MARTKGATADKVLLREATKKSLLETARSALKGDSEAQRTLVHLYGKETLEAIANR